MPDGGGPGLWEHALHSVSVVPSVFVVHSEQLGVSA